jgi:hypothetical protein
MAVPGRCPDQGPAGCESTGKNLTDRGKLGVKRSLVLEGQLVPIGVAIDGANRHDKKLVKGTIDSIPVQRPDLRPEHSQGLCLDQGYDEANPRELAFAAHVRARGEEAQAIKKEAGFRARGWVAERTQSWDEPVPADPDPLGEESDERPGPVALRLRLDHVSILRSTRIGSNQSHRAWLCQRAGDGPPMGADDPAAARRPLQAG